MKKNEKSFTARTAQSNPMTDTQLREMAASLDDNTWARHKSDAREREALILAALKSVQNSTADRCVQIVDDADIESCGGYERQDDARATLRGAIADIRKDFAVSPSPPSVEPTPQALWRVGKQVPVNLYRNGLIAGQCQSPEIAAEIVRVMNGGGYPVSPLVEPADAANRESAFVLKPPYWRCVCGTVAMPLTDNTTCLCGDIYLQEWTRVEVALPICATTTERVTLKGLPDVGGGSEGEQEPL